ncbi:MAG: PhnD/SsuA/transferrin family substrate-binding protein, partial [Thermodesulfovibrionales bacterium]
IDDLKGKRVAFVKSSTAAHLVPLGMLAEEKITLEMIKPIYFPSQEQVIRAVMVGKADAGAVKSGLFEIFMKKGLKSIKISSPLPNFVFCASNRVPEQVIKAFTDALIKIKPLTNPKHMKLTERWDHEIRNGFKLPHASYVKDASKILEYEKLVK